MLSERGHEVIIVRTEQKKSLSTTHPTQLPVFWWQDLSPASVEERCDAVILNIGDNYGYHAGILAYIDALPCLGIFHDFYLFNFFRNWVDSANLTELAYERELLRVYDDNVLTTARRAWRGEASDEEISSLFPMTEWLGRRCGAALGHANFYLDRLIRSCAGPVDATLLCFDSRNVAPLPIRGTDEVVLTTVGLLNANKCADAVISAIGSSQTLRQRCRYRLVGDISALEQARLRELCKEIGFDRVDFLGPVDDATLISEIERADILMCLRKPVLEGASASAIEGMRSGRPIIVADAGFYSELPDDVVFKVPGSVDVAALAEVMGRLVCNETLRRSVGLRARQWADSAFDAKVYVESIERLVTRFVEAKPLLDVGRHYGQQLAALGASPNHPAVDRLTQKMSELFLGNE